MENQTAMQLLKLVYFPFTNH